MRSKILVLILTTALLTLSACDRRDENSDGNGPGNADGFGGRTDAPPTDRSDPAAEPQQPAEPQQQPQQ